ncbi:hypothetical protein HU200_060562 [Digitaria exilis]|uniref:Uncharacterized protein n=1 Tax=Digitaria exilis TaxID=1010633 RepID=A0A835A925_9POAL|nr:hypothetical protein HU200_060562 [Digitaria exilis]
MKNASISDYSSRSHSLCEGALYSQLVVENEGLAVLEEQMEEQKKQSEATKVEFVKLKKQQEEVMRMLSNNPSICGTFSKPFLCVKLLSSQP